MTIPRMMASLGCASGLLAGCADAPVSSNAKSIRDSAGIQIVENLAATVPTSAQWSAGEIEISIGSADDAPGQQLHRVVGATRLRDGTIVIANAGGSELLRYASEGTYLGAVGQAGEGPGQFQALAWLGRTQADSLMAWDRRLNRVTVFFASGEYARDYQPSLPEDIVGTVRGSLAGGELLLSRGASFAPVAGEAGVQRQPLTVWLTSATGQVLQEFGPFPGESIELRQGRNQPGAVIRTIIPFGPTTLVAAGSDRIHIADNSKYEVHVYTRDGHLERIIRRPSQEIRLSAEDIEADIAARLELLPPIDEVRAGMRASYDAVAKPALIPPIRSIIADNEGCLWVEAGRHLTDPSSIWTVFDSTGRWITDVSLPAEFEVMEIGPDYMLARQKDELGVESVRLVALQRAG